MSVSSTPSSPRYPGADRDARPDVSTIEDVLHGAGYRSTRPRRTIIETILDQAHPFTPEHLLAAVHRADPSLGRATVYRTLEILGALDVLTRVVVAEGHSAYVVGLPGHRHHLVCSGCGAAVPFTACPVDHLMAELSRTTNFAIQSHVLQFIGVCPACQPTP
ncbi:MAG: transcriptional repressor [Chloroflexia bacterium]|nr:transcriptional repressor [Chloroflexia bacterium]